ncbi:hypothetical protein LP421_13325 [Rhizobium sp. RCAM05350]|nr:hypothetical protein LP421_13325 [Rhizobium sp. RCAM05350]
MSRISTAPPSESIYPATGEVIARLHAATPAIVDKAIAAAKARKANGPR